MRARGGGRIESRGKQGSKLDGEVRGQQRRVEEGKMDGEWRKMGERWPITRREGGERERIRRRMTEIKGERRKWGEAAAKMGRGSESLSRKLMEKSEEKHEKGKSGTMSVVKGGKQTEGRKSEIR